MVYPPRGSGGNTHAERHSWPLEGIFPVRFEAVKGGILERLGVGDLCLLLDPRPAATQDGRGQKLVPEIRYGHREGHMASLELERLLFHGAELTEDTKARLRTDLLR